MSERNTCPICGEPTFLVYGKYPRKDGLCKQHSQMLFNEEIETCPKCGNLYIIEDGCDCEKNKAVIDEEKNNVVIINEQNKHKCITCGRQVDGVLFCTSCYRKYKNKELYLKISNCSNVELLDENYEGRFTCKDGHIVKSKSEREIDNYLFDHGISHAYEKKLYYGDTEKEVLHPDFYLPNYLGEGKHVYIEHWGYNENNIQYTKTKKFKIPIYKKLDITLICTFEKTDSADIDTALDRKLNKSRICENQINFDIQQKESEEDDIIMF